MYHKILNDAIRITKEMDKWQKLYREWEKPKLTKKKISCKVNSKHWAHIHFRVVFTNCIPESIFIFFFYLRFSSMHFQVRICSWHTGEYSSKWSHYSSCYHLPFHRVRVELFRQCFHFIPICVLVMRNELKTMHHQFGCVHRKTWNEKLEHI